MNLTDPYFFSFTIYRYTHLFKADKYKNVIVQQLSSLAAKDEIVLNAFLIMPDEIELVMQLKNENGEELIQKLLKKISGQLRYDLQKNHPVVLACNAGYQEATRFFDWNSQTKNIQLPGEMIYQQKLEEMHARPVSRGLCERPEAYFYSSAFYYQSGKNDFGCIKKCSF